MSAAVSFARQVDELLAFCGETLEDDLLDAVKELRAIAAEHDAIDVRFYAAAGKVKAILDGKIGGAQ